MSLIKRSHSGEKKANSCGSGALSSVAAWELARQTVSTSDPVHPFAHLPITEVPGLKAKATLLREKNPYEPFDGHVVFYDDVPDEIKLPQGTKREHLYLVNALPYRGSCTGFLGEYFSDFDPVVASEKIVGSLKWHNDSSYRYFKMSKEDIMAEWKNANKLGTRFHMCVELFFNGLEQTAHPDFRTKEFDHHFRNFHRDFVVGKLRPWRTEWIVFDRLYELVGSIDMVFQRIDCDNPYSLVLYDWKRCLKIEADAFQNESAKGPFEGLPKAKFWQYSMQLNVYKYVIEKNTPYKIEEMVLLRCHPDSDNYERLVVPDLQYYVRRAVEVRFRQIMQMDLDLLASTILANECSGMELTQDEEKEEAVEKETVEKEQGKGVKEEYAPISLARLAVQVRRRFEDYTAQISSGALQAPTFAATTAADGEEGTASGEKGRGGGGGGGGGARGAGATVPPQSFDESAAKKAKKPSLCSRCTREVEEDFEMMQPQQEQRVNEQHSWAAKETSRGDPRLAYVFEPTAKPTGGQTGQQQQQQKNRVSFSSSTTGGGGGGGRFSSSSSAATSATTLASQSASRWTGRGSGSANSFKSKYSKNRDSDNEDGNDPQDEGGAADPRLSYRFD